VTISGILVLYVATVLVAWFGFHLVLTALERTVEKLVELLAVETEVKALLLKLHDAVVDPAKLDEVLAAAKANRDALAAMVPAEQPAPTV